MPCSTQDQNASGCFECRGRKLLYDEVRTLGVYDGPLRQAVLRTKHYQSEPLAAALGMLLAQRLQDLPLAEQPEIVAPVPMHWLRRLWRGTNAPDTLAAAIGRGLGLPIAYDLLVCRRLLRRQSQLTAQERRANVRNAYRVAWAYDLRGARVLLVDDVTTTGATAQDAARAVRAAGAAMVSIAAVARGTGTF